MEDLLSYAKDTSAEPWTQPTSVFWCVLYKLSTKIIKLLYLFVVSVLNIHHTLLPTKNFPKTMVCVCVCVCVCARTHAWVCVCVCICMCVFMCMLGLFAENSKIYRIIRTPQDVKNFTGRLSTWSKLWLLKLILQRALLCAWGRWNNNT